MSQVSNLRSHLSSLTSHLSSLTSHLSPLTSHVSSLTSPVSRLTFHLLQSLQDRSPAWGRRVGFVGLLEKVLIPLAVEFHLRGCPQKIHLHLLAMGSRVFKGTARKLAAVTKNAGLKKKRQKLLFRLGYYFMAENMLELGTSVGLGTVALSLSNKYAFVNTVEGCPNTAKKADAYFKKFNLKNIKIHQQTFKEYLSSHPEEKFDLIFIDGDHNGERTLGYFNSFLNRIHNDSIIIFDDIYWSKDMTAAWQEIIANENVTVSIDTFQWGIVFFRKEQPKQHFVIRV